MRHLPALLLLMILQLPLMAQDGSPFITHFNLRESVYNNQNWAIAQDEDEVMLFANRRGILTYDGVQWREIKTPDFPYTLHQSPQSGLIFVGCRGDYGFLDKDEKGLYFYNSLTGDAGDVSDILQVAVTEDHVYFYSEKTLTSCRYNDLNNIRTWDSRPEKPFRGMFEYQGNIYINVSGKGLHHLINDSIQFLQNGRLFIGQEILFSLPFINNEILIGTDRDVLYRFDGQKFTRYQTEAQEYINQNVLAGGLEMNAGSIALSTITGGCIILEKESGDIIHSINYQSGLPDNEVFAMGKDRNGGLWLSHEYGLSRVDNSLPIRNFNTYPGLKGNLNAVVNFNNTIYVSTSEGIFFLDELKDFKAEEIIVESTQPREEKEDDSDSEIADTETQENEKLSARERRKMRRKEKRQSFFEKLFGDEESNDKNPGDSEEDDDGQENPEQQARTVYTLQSISYVFQKVNGIDEKCKQLVAHNGHLFAGSNTGLYRISGKSATRLIENRYVNCIIPSRNKQSVYVGTSSGVLTLMQSANGWQVKSELSEFTENVYSITEGNNQTLWLGSDDVVYKVNLTLDILTGKYRPIYFENDYSEKVLTTEINDEIRFLLSGGAYYYNAEKDTVLPKYTSLSSGANNRYILTQKDVYWQYNMQTESWQHFTDRDTEVPWNERYLELFEGIQFIYADAQNNLWVIDSKNELYKVMPYNTGTEEQEFNVYIRNVSDLSSEDAFFSLNKLELEAGTSSLAFKIAAPYYLKSSATEYQYIVEGLMGNWSKWSTDAVIEFPYSLPAGTYTLKVRARNILGEESEVKSLSFRVKPPFYKTWWAFVIYGAFLILLIYLIVKAREAQLKKQRKVLEEKVKLRTAQLAEQKNKVEELLLNILPKDTAEELKTKGKATARHYHMASVMFTDFKGFTMIAEKTKPKELVEELDICFQKFDEIIEKYKLEKIKTIGDAYMCAGGLPRPDDNNPLLITLAALEIRDFIETMRKEREQQGQEFWELRIGIHSGPLTTGVVGKKKFAYDIWGDSVNTASRMESSGQPGKVNISGTTYEFIKKYFNCKYRGMIEAKNKGRIDMYFVQGIKEEFSVNGKGKLPNEVFLEKLGIQVEGAKV